MPTHIAALILFSMNIASGVVLDRIAAVAGNRVVKLSNLDREIRITAFQNGEKPDLSPKAKRKALERLIDQEMIRKEIESGQYPMAGEEEAKKLLGQLLSERYRSDPEVEAALLSYGITREQLLAKLRWQLTVLRFIDQRFRPGANVSDADVVAYYRQHATELNSPIENSRDRIRETLSGKKVDEQFESWLEQARKNVKVEVYEQAFQN
jgi:hypothetical protein